MKKQLIIITLGLSTLFAATTVAAKSSLCLFFTADQRQTDDRDKQRGPKQHDAIHPRSSKKVKTTTRTRATVYLRTSD